MDSKTYWKNREAEQRKHNIQDEKEYAKHIQKIYQNMIDEIEKEINGFYGKYAKAEGITLAEARKRASKADIEALGRKAEKYVKEKDFSKRANEEMRLYNMTMKVNRLELLKAQIGLEMVSGFDELQKYYGEILTERTLSEFERQAGILGETIQNNAKAAHAIVNASFHNATYSDRIWMYQDMLKNELNSLLQAGLIRGQNPRKLATHLRKRFGVSQSNAERLMITELARVQTEAQKQSFERNGFEEYTFLALGTACPVCRALDGKHFEVAKMMPGTNAPPMHPRCRCSVAAYENSDDYEAWLDFLDKDGKTDEWSRLKKNGKSVANRLDGDLMKISIPNDVYKESGMKRQTKEKIEQAIKKLESEYTVYIDGIEGGKMGRKDIFGSGGYIDEDGTLKFALLFNYDIDYQRVEHRMKYLYNKGEMAGKTFEDYIAHEIAHILPFQNCITEEDYRRTREELRNSFIAGVSGYADRTQDGAESLAEAFVRYRNGEVIPDEAKKLIRKYIHPWRK